MSTASKWKDRKVLIVGFGISGQSMARYLMTQGSTVLVSESKTKDQIGEAIITEFEGLGVQFELGGNTTDYFLKGDVLLVSPGVPLNIKPIEDYKTTGREVTNDVNHAFELIKEPVIAITGTNGKTTVTHLVTEMFRQDQKPAFMGGNIGIPLITYVQQPEKAHAVVVELSSFQLELTRNLVPAVAVITNLDQDHLDRYGTMEAYFEAKRTLVKACDKNSYVVLNHGNDWTKKMAQDVTGKVIWFRLTPPTKSDGEIDDKFVGSWYDAEAKCLFFKFAGKIEKYSLEHFRLLGDHNKENLMAALCAARLMGITPKAVQLVIDQFKGVAHRIEFLRKKDGVYFFNDSKATNVNSLTKSLQSFRRSPIILIAGGRDKGIDFTSAQNLVRNKVKILILMGEAKEKLNRIFGDLTETYLVGTMEEAVLMAYHKSRTGDVVLLSPGCASYDMYKNYEERGDYFRKLVHSL